MEGTVYGSADTLYGNDHALYDTFQKKLLGSPKYYTLLNAVQREKDFRIIKPQAIYLWFLIVRLMI